MKQTHLINICLYSSMLEKSGSLQATPRVNKFRFFPGLIMKFPLFSNPGQQSLQQFFNYTLSFPLARAADIQSL